MKTVAKLVKTARERKGLDKKKVGELLGLKGGQFVAEIESGESPLPLTKSRAICKILGIKKSTLYRAFLKDHKAKLKNVLDLRKR